MAEKKKTVASKTKARGVVKSVAKPAASKIAAMKPAVKAAAAKPVAAKSAAKKPVIAKSVTVKPVIKTVAKKSTATKSVAAKSAAAKPASAKPAVAKSKSTLRTVEFHCFSPASGIVEVAGDFNGWIPSKNPLTRGLDGHWSVKVKMLPGRYTYKFVYDGVAWELDREAPAMADLDGHLNSVIDVV